MDLGSPGALPGQRCSLYGWGYSRPDNLLARQVASAKGYPGAGWANLVSWALVVLWGLRLPYLGGLHLS